MKCAEIQKLLNDYVDGELREYEKKEVTVHLLRCPGCRKEEEALRFLSEEALALPKSVEPARDLWPALESRIRRKKLLGMVTGGVPAPSKTPVRPGLVAAAAVLILVLSIAALRHFIREPQAPPAPAAALTPAEILPARQSVTDLASAEAEYLKAVQELTALLNHRKRALSPKTMSVVSQNLKTVDSAIVQIKKALEAEPDNRKFTTLLMATYQKEVDLLQRATKRSASM
jgi:hypothetical protein